MSFNNPSLVTDLRSQFQWDEAHIQNSMDKYSTLFGYDSVMQTSSFLELGTGISVVNSNTPAIRTVGSHAKNMARSVPNIGGGNSRSGTRVHPLCPF